MKTPVGGDSPSHRTLEEAILPNALCGVSLQRSGGAVTQPIIRFAGGRPALFCEGTVAEVDESGSLSCSLPSSKDSDSPPSGVLQSKAEECVHEVFLRPILALIALGGGCALAPRRRIRDRVETRTRPRTAVLDWGKRWSQSLGRKHQCHQRRRAAIRTREMPGVMVAPWRPRAHYDRWRDIDGQHAHSEAAIRRAVPRRGARRPEANAMGGASGGASGGNASGGTSAHGGATAGHSRALDDRRLDDRRLDDRRLQVRGRQERRRHGQRRSQWRQRVRRIGQRRRVHFRCRHSRFISAHHQRDQRIRHPLLGLLQAILWLVRQREWQAVHTCGKDGPRRSTTTRKAHAAVEAIHVLLGRALVRERHPVLRLCRLQRRRLRHLLPISSPARGNTTTRTQGRSPSTARR